MENQGIDIFSILTVLYYTILDNLSLVILVIILPLLTYIFIKPKTPIIKSRMRLFFVSIALGITGALLAPYLTNSSLTYILVPIDWFFFFSILIGLSAYCFFTLLPLRRGQK